MKNMMFIQWAVRHPGLNDNEEHDVHSMAERHPGLNDNEELCTSIFFFPFRTARGTQLQTFQFKIIDRLINNKQCRTVWKET